MNIVTAKIPDELHLRLKDEMVDATYISDLIVDTVFKVIYPSFDLTIALVIGIPAVLWLIASVYIRHSDDEVNHTR